MSMLRSVSKKLHLGGTSRKSGGCASYLSHCNGEIMDKGYSVQEESTLACS